MTKIKDIEHDNVTSFMNAITAVVHAIIVVAKAADEFKRPTQDSINSKNLL